MYLIFSTILILLITRLWQVLPSSSHKSKRTINVCSTCIVLGSGGHTTEMLQMMKGLDPARYQPRSYIIADTDALSKEKAKMQETNFGSSADQYAIHRIPRARHVGQPWATVPWSLAKAVLQSATVFFRQMPDLILCNGPGSCIPICILAYISRYLGIKAIQIIYVESFARVHTLSLTGKILYYFADEFIVQWPQLSQRYKRAKYTGILI